MLNELDIKIKKFKALSLFLIRLIIGKLKKKKKDWPQFMKEFLKTLKWKLIFLNYGKKLLHSPEQISHGCVQSFVNSSVFVAL